jgi:methionyl-tRNA formyltransferase
MRHRLVLLGSDEIALAAFVAARALPAVEVVAVYSQPDRPAGRGQAVRANPVAAWARQEGLTLLQPEKLSAEDAAHLRALDVSLGVVMAYGQILKDDFLQAPRLGLVNFHGSLLPALRGATPVEGALAAGLDVTGVSLQQVVRKLDAGPLHASAPLTIAPNEGRAALRARLGVLAGELATRVLPVILAGASVPLPQDEALVSYTRRLTRQDAALDFNEDARFLAGRIAAMEGWPGSTFECHGVVIKVGAAQAVAAPAAAPAGTILSADKSGVLIACGAGACLLTQLQRPGGKMLPAGEFLAGFPLIVGTLLSSVAMPPLIASAPFPRLPKA